MRKPPALTVSSIEKELFDELNNARTRAGIRKLEPNAKLFIIARSHAQHMARVEQMNHVLDGKSPTDRGRTVGYPTAVDEVFNGGATSAKRAVSDWLGVATLQAKLLNPANTEIGIGFAQSPDSTNVWNLTIGASPEAKNPPELRVQ